MTFPSFTKIDSGSCRWEVMTFLVPMPIWSKDGRRLWRRNRWKWYLVFSRNVRVDIRPPERRLHLPYVGPNHFHTSILWTLSILLRPKILVNVLRTILFGRTLDPDLLPPLQDNLMSRTNSLSLNHLFRSQHPVHRTEFCQIRQGQRLSTVSFLSQNKEGRRRKKSMQIGRNHLLWQKAFSLTVTLSRTFLTISRNSSQNFSSNSNSLRRRRPDTSLPASRVNQP